MGLQYGIKEVLNLSIVDYATNKPVLYSDYAAVSSNANTAERLKIKGGWGNVDQLSFDHSRESTINVTMPLVDLKAVAMLTGEDLVTGASDIFKREVLVVAADNTVKLSAAPLANSLFVADLAGVRDYGKEITLGSATPAAGQYAINDKVISLNATSHPEGSEIVVTYLYASATTAKKISIRGNKFPKAVKIYGTGLARNQEDEKDYPVHVTVHKARPQANFTFTMEGTNATNLEIVFDTFTVVDTEGHQQLVDYVFE
ncbi:hypothetical protein [Paenibacillus sp. NPDC058174]|uniref:hypothetical protein n=1 Tax=Paenibacillus sp. NPDC058174 TaxID=3346366 RepID=UPI0036DCFF99